VTEEPEFLTLDEILEIHDDQIQHYGGDVGIAIAAFSSRLSRCPSNRSAGSISTETSSRWRAAYAFHVAESQAFVDGNKRTGLAAAYVFLALNGFRLIEQEDRLYEAMIAVGTRRLDKAGLAQLLRELSAAEE
jgi:death-on-curing protein